MSTLYEKDFHAWCFDQVSFLSSKDLENIDWEHLIEEITSMGGSVRQELENRLIVLFAHLLKWKFQEHLRSKSWERTIKEQRRRVKRNLHRFPSLKNHLNETAEAGYEYSILEACKETNMPENTFPEKMPWTIDEALTEGWLP